MLMKLKYTNTPKIMLTGKERANVSLETEESLIILMIERVVLVEVLALLRKAMAKEIGEMLRKKQEKKNILLLTILLKVKSPRLLLKAKKCPDKLRTLMLT